MIAYCNCQPISTAPKDGTVIDLWHKDGFRVENCFYDPSHQIWFKENCMDGPLYGHEFSHWSPIVGPKQSAILASEEADYLIASYEEATKKYYIPCDVPEQDIFRQGFEAGKEFMCQSSSWDFTAEDALQSYREEADSDDGMGM